MIRNSKVILFFVMAALLVLSVGCSSSTKTSAPEKPKKPDVLDAGIVTGSVYRNEYFGLTIVIPDNWDVQSEETKKELQEIGKNAMANGDEAKKAAMDRAADRSASLLFASKYPMGTPDKTNANYGAAAEKVSAFPGIKTGKDYLVQVRQLMQGSTVKCTFKEIYSEKIDGVDFDVLECSIDVQGTTVKQKYYTAIMREYALLINITYVAPEDADVLNKAVKAVKIDK